MGKGSRYEKQRWRVNGNETKKVQEKEGGEGKKRREGNKMREKRKERKRTLTQEADLLCESQTSVFSSAGALKTQLHNICSINPCQVKRTCPGIGQGAK